MIHWFFAEAQDEDKRLLSSALSFSFFVSDPSFSECYWPNPLPDGFLVSAPSFSEGLWAGRG